MLLNFTKKEGKRGMAVHKELFRSTKVAGVEENSAKLYELDYYLLEKEVNVDGFAINTFGVGVTKRTVEDGKTVDLEYRRVYDVFCSKRETLVMLDKLARGAVTPVSLLEVLQDVVGIGDLVNEEVCIGTTEISDIAAG